MASLAIIVSLIFLSLLIIGPLTYFSAFLGLKLISWVLALISILVGIWALFIPVPLFRIIGLINIGIGAKIIMDSSKKKTQG